MNSSKVTPEKTPKIKSVNIKMVKAPGATMPKSTIKTKGIDTTGIFKKIDNNLEKRMVNMKIAGMSAPRSFYKVAGWGNILMRDLKLAGKGFMKSQSGGKLKAIGTAVKNDLGGGWKNFGRNLKASGSTAITGKMPGVTTANSFFQVDKATMRRAARGNLLNTIKANPYKTTAIGAGILGSGKMMTPGKRIVYKDRY